MDDADSREGFAQTLASKVNWSHLLTASRHSTDDGSATRDSTKVLHQGTQSRNEKFDWKQALVHQLTCYVNLCSHGISDTTRGLISQNSYDDEDVKRVVIRDTRFALRYALSRFAHGTDSGRMALQTSLVQGWGCDEPLSRILAHSSCDADSSYCPMDSKCRLYAARLWCNLLTQNPITTQYICRKMPLSPTADVQRERLLRSIQQCPDDNELSKTPVPTSISWYDFVRQCSSQREAVAAIVAALYNAIIVDTSSSSSSSAISGPERLDQQVANDSLLLCALLRQVVSAKAILTSASGMDNNSSSPNESSATRSDTMDEATEWILMLVEKLVRLGHLPDMYQSIATQNNLNDASIIAALPEHVVLLFSIQTALHQSIFDTASSRSLPLCDSLDKTKRTVAFLSNLYGALSSHSSSSDESMSIMERDAVCLRTLDILAEMLQHDGPTLHPVRQYLGQCGIFPYLAIDLAHLVDHYTALLQVTQEAPVEVDGSATVEFSADTNTSPSTSKLRDVSMSAQEKEHLTSIIRLLGNLCYNCRSNQDLMGTTSAKASSNPVVEIKERTLLHLLLTSTSLAPLCFTVREWAVVAIRNVLEDNVGNQAIVAQLQAQQPVRSATLESMGVRVDLDNSSGTVHVVPLDSINETETEDEPR